MLTNDLTLLVLHRSGVKLLSTQIVTAFTVPHYCGQNLTYFQL